MVRTKINHTKIDVHNNILTIEFDGKLIKLNVYDYLKYPFDVIHIDNIDAISSLRQNRFELSIDNKLNVALCTSMDMDNPKRLNQQIVTDEEL